MTTNQIISARIAYNFANGMTEKEAIDAVLGAGTYDKLVSDLYNALRAKSQAN